MDCHICQQEPAPAELVFCYRCGRSYHRQCFVAEERCVNPSCLTTVYTANDGSGAVDVAKERGGQREEGREEEKERNKSGEPDLFGWRLALACLLAFCAMIALSAAFAVLRAQ